MYPCRISASVLCCLIVQSSYASECNQNSWTKPTSGYWEEGYWSCGHLPYPDDVVSFANNGWTALAIGASTTANSPDSLSVYSLTIAAPYGSSNTLLLNYAGTNVALLVQSLLLETNGNLVSY